jgi:Transglycosylase
MMVPIMRSGRILLEAASWVSDSILSSALCVSARKLAVAVTLPSHLVQQLLAIEDKRFAWHPGVDLLALVRVCTFNLLVRPPRLHGGSTITQQIYSTIARRSGLYSHSLGFKTHQIGYAVRLSRALKKSSVLKLYLETVYFGKSIYGIDSASRLYCNRTPQELTPAESFFLVERIARPNGVCPARIAILVKRTPIRSALSTDPNAMEVLVSLYQRHFGCGEVIASCLEKSLRKSAVPTYSSFLAVSSGQ